MGLEENFSLEKNRIYNLIHLGNRLKVKTYGEIVVKDLASLYNVDQTFFATSKTLRYF